MTQKPITQVSTTDVSDMLNPGRQQRMDLPGFDDEFVDFPDYIIRITDRIWHERKVDLINRYYAQECIVHTQAGTAIGLAPVIDGTRATMTAYPDRVLEADNVIWSKDAPQPGSDSPVFYSSHRITSKMTNLGPSEFGPATGNKVRVITLAECACRDNVIFEEWLVRDYAAIVTQLGLDVDAVAADLARQDIAADVDLIAGHADNIARIHAAPALATQRPAEPETNPEQFAQAFFAAIWQAQDESQLGDFYDFRVRGLYPGGLDLYGHDEIQPALANLLGALSGVKVSIDHVCDIPYLGGARDVSVRWSLTGTHSGTSPYGTPTGAQLYVLGVSHFRLINGRIHLDVTIWDDVALRRMIEGIRQRGNQK